MISASPIPHSTGTGHHSWPVCGSDVFDPDGEEDPEGDFGVDGVTEGYGVSGGVGGILNPFFGAASIS